MNTSSPRRAVVLGASMAGLTSAKALAHHFDEVVVLERDELPGAPAHRKGVPQGRHAHGLLCGGRLALDRLFPGFSERAIRDGAEAGDFSRSVMLHAGGGYHRRFDSGLASLLLSRCLIESTVRDLVRSEPNVRLLAPARAIGPRWSADGRSVDGVEFAFVAAPERVESIGASLVVDATGRASRLPGWLAARGHRVPAESRVRSDVVYATREFERRPGDLPDDARVLLLTADPPHPRGGAILAVERDRWVMTVFGMAGERPEATEEGFVAFAQTLAVPDFARLARTRLARTDVASYRIEGSRRRHYERMPIPDGILPVGDAICSFNPVFGQGMTVAAMQAVALDEELARGPAGLSRRFLKRASALVDAPWEVAAGADLRFPQIEGPRPATLGAINRYLVRLHRAAQHDEVAALAFHRVLNLIDPPAAILSPKVMWHVLRPTHGVASMHARAAGAGARH